ncbi:MAG: hypothetical protein ABI191_00455 [Rhizomicrobium sp.]
MTFNLKISDLKTSNLKTGYSTMRNGTRLAVIAVAALQLAACASAAKPEAMIAMPAASAQPFPQGLQHAMCVRAVTGGQKTNALWVSKVDDQSFQTALTASLSGAGLVAQGSACSFPVDVNLLGLSQPIAGFDMTVTSHVNYKVYDPAGQPLVLATIDTPYTADFSAAFVAAERLRLANEGSIRTNIGQFLDKLRQAEVKSSAPATTAASGGN